MTILSRLAFLAALAIPAAAFGAGSSDEQPPEETKTTTECKDGQIWDEETKACTDAQDSRLDDDERYRAVRELAYAGMPEEALMVLDAMAEGDTDRVMTYRGFANRKAGRIEEGMMWYARALEANPDNLLARSYMGQSFVEMGEFDLAQAQLDEIVARGGTGRWPETALRRAIADGQTYSY